MRRASVFFAVLAGCAGPTEQAPEEELPAQILSSPEQINRASMAIRGVRATPDELSTNVEQAVDAWLESKEFRLTLNDLHAELYLLRRDTTHQLPSRGALALKEINQQQIYESTTEAPLQLVSEIIATNQPYTNILTADYAMVDEIVADIYGTSYDPDGPRWQHSRWIDGRPHAGLLSDSEMWRRHVSNAANFHRGRANFISRTFLCEDIGGRDVLVEGGVDISDVDAVAQAVNTQPTCVGCHSVLDPMAAFFWGYKEQLQRGAILAAYDAGCDWKWENGGPPREEYRVEHWCYPLQFWDVQQEKKWEELGLPAPAYFGQPASTMADLGKLITEDPRFAECTTRNFASYLMQTPRKELPELAVDRWTKTFIEDDFNAKNLVRNIVLSEEMMRRTDSSEEWAAGLQTIRPEQWSRTLKQLTGFVWIANQDDADCTEGSNDCWETVDLNTTDLYGFRSMAGGINSKTVTHPTHTATPTKIMAMALASQEAAGFLVREDFAKPSNERLVLTLVEPTDTDLKKIEAQLAEIHRTFLAQDLVSSQLKPTVDLWAALYSTNNNPSEAWMGVITAILRDPAMVYY